MPKMTYELPVTVKFTEAWRTPDEFEGRERWPEGVWDDEPDKIVWVDLATGLDCMIHRGPLGALCGYVGVSRRHPLFGKEYGDWSGENDTSTVDSLCVHGGITYAAACSPTGTEEHGVCHVPQPGRPKHVWWFGFDCNHSGDIAPSMLALEVLFPTLGAFARPWHYSYKPVAYVAQECTNLAQQLAFMS